MFLSYKVFNHLTCSTQFLPSLVGLSLTVFLEYGILFTYEVFNFRREIYIPNDFRRDEFLNTDEHWSMSSNWNDGIGEKPNMISVRCKFLDCRQRLFFPPPLHVEMTVGFQINKVMINWEITIAPGATELTSLMISELLVSRRSWSSLPHPGCVATQLFKKIISNKSPERFFQMPSVICRSWLIQWPVNSWKIEITKQNNVARFRSSLQRGI